MLKAKDEYLNPSQNYRRKDKFDYLYTNRQTKVNFLPQKMSFILIEQKITQEYMLNQLAPIIN